VRLVYSQSRHAIPVPDAVITYIAGTITESFPIPASPIPSSSPTSGPNLVPSLSIPLDSAPSVLFHSDDTLAAETLSIPNTIASPPTIAPVPSPPSPVHTTIPPAMPALDDVADPAPDEPVGKKTSKKMTERLEKWWSDHRQDVVSGAKTLLELASDALDAIPVGGPAAAKVLDLGAKTLERVQVSVARLQLL
jgi:hypothetical protein